MVDRLVLYQKIYDLILYSFPIINRFPKSQKFVLGQQIENIMINMLAGTIHANNASQKLDYLKNIDVDLQLCKTLIRLTKDLKIIDFRRYMIFSKKLTEIGKILGGWIRREKQG